MSKEAHMDAGSSHQLGDDYQYPTLAGPISIRLLRADVSGVEPSFPVIETHIESAPPYVAISYVWGDPSIKKHVDLPDGAIGITESLNLALGDVLHCLQDQKHGNFWHDRTVHIWADALCIDQRNTKEKNIQVPMMTEISASAALVVTYMGPETDDSEAAIDLLWQILLFYNEKGQQPPERRILEPDYDLIDLGLPPSNHSSWKALRRLFRRPWPTRVWVVQEFLANKNTILLCGKRVLPSWKILFLLFHAYYSNEIPKECMEDHENPTVENHSTISCLMHVMGLRHKYQTRDRETPLSTLLHATSYQNSSDLRDKVFAMLNLARDREALDIRPDYSPTVTVKDVYTEATVRVIQHEKHFGILSSVGMQRSYQDEYLPSWVVDWSAAKLNKMNNVLDWDMGGDERCFRASGESSIHVSFNVGHTEMTITGKIIDTLIPLITDSTENWSDLAILHRLDCIQHTTLQTGNQIYDTTDGIRTAFIRALTYGANFPDKQMALHLEVAFSAWLISFTVNHVRLGPWEEKWRNASTIILRIQATIARWETRVKAIYACCRSGCSRAMSLRSLAEAMCRM
jgi:hypothetical protein